jgi:ribokinase
VTWPCACILRLTGDEMGLIVGIGDVVVDICLSCRNYPALGDKANCGFEGYTAGGTVANSMVASARLGLQAVLLGRVGDDPQGQAALKEVEASGVDISRVRIMPGVQTPWTLIVSADDGERAIFVVTSDMGPMDLGKEDYELIRKADVLYIAPGRKGEESEWRAVDAAKETGKLVAIDAERPVLEMMALNGDPLKRLAKADIVFLNSDGCQYLSSLMGLDADDALTEVSKIGPGFVVNTRGSMGARVAVNGYIACEVEAYRTRVVDTTGAGDCFNAAFLYGVISRWDLQDTLRFANAAGAIAVTGKGPRGAVPTAQQIWEVVKKGEVEI